MNPVQRGAALLFSVCAAVFVPRLGFAADGPPAPPTEQRALRLQYAAPLECPDAEGFFSRVRARTQRVRLAAPDELADLVDVKIVHGPNGEIGTLDLPPVDSRAFSRRVEATSCEEVVLALSLVLALSYDPDAITTFPSVVTAPNPPPLIAPSSPAPAPVPGPASVSPSEPAPLGAAAGLTVLGTGGIAPHLHAVLGPFIEYGSNSDRLFSPRGIVSLLVEVPEANVPASLQRSVTLRFFGGQIQGCPIWIHLVKGVTAAPCLAFDVGQIIGSGSDSVESAQTGSLWRVALEAVARLRSSLAGPLFAEVVGSGGVTLAPGEFTLVGVGPVTHVYKIPIGFGSFGLGLGVHFR